VETRKVGGLKTKMRTRKVTTKGNLRHRGRCQGSINGVTETENTENDKKGKSGKQKWGSLGGKASGGGGTQPSRGEKNLNKSIEDEDGPRGGEKAIYSLKKTNVATEGKNVPREKGTHF